MSQQTGILKGGAALGAPARSASPARPAPAGTKRVTSGASLLVGGALVWQVSNFAFNAVGAHALGPGRYGVLAASLALLALATPALAAVQAVASREATSLAAKGELGKAAPILRHYGFRVTCGAVVLGGAAAAASGWVSSLFHLGSPWLVVIAGASLPCYMVSHLLGGVLQGAERFGRFGLESAVEGSAKAVLGAVAMGLLWRSALSGMVAVFASCVVGLVTYLLLALPLLGTDGLAPSVSPGPAGAAARTRPAHRRERAGESRGVARYSVTALVTYGLLALMLSSDTLIARHYLPSHQAGLYAGVSLAGKIPYFTATSLYVVAFPVFSRHDDQGAGSRRWVLATGGLVCAITAAIVAVFTFEPAWVVIPLLGGRYQAAEGYLPPMAAVFGLYSLGFLVSIYLLARRRRGIIALLAAAAAVQFACFFAFHSTITKMMGGLAAAFGVLLAGGVCLAAAGAGRGTRTPARGSVPAQALPPSASVPGMPAGPPRECPALPGREGNIVAEVTRRAGAVPVLLAGSRALGTAHPHSDYDIVVVLPLLRIPRAVPRLAAASERLSADFGVRVSVNPVPRFRMRRPGGSLFVRKLQAEALVLAAPRGWSLPRRPLTGVTALAACSVLLSAVQGLLENFDTSAMRALRAPSRGCLARRQAALRKAALHVAHVRLLRQGLYAADLPAALALLRGTPAGGNGGMPGAALSAELTAGLAEADPVEGFARVRACILGELAEITDVPLRRPAGASLVRNAQYAALAALRGRSRWRAALRRAPVETAFASAQLTLLRALDPRSADGVDAALLRLAAAALPVPAVPPQGHTWEGVRDLVLAEWPDAHPLAGVLA